MPAKSIAQRKHIERLNGLNQTIASRFKLGQAAWNLKYVDLPRNKWRQPLVPCKDCLGVLVTIYSDSGRCRKCGHKARHKTEPRIWKSGYVYMENGNKPKPQHIRIAEQVLGRSMKAGEHVHHINLDKTDNRNSNLLICDSSYHKWLHHRYAVEFARRFLFPPSL